MNLQNAEPYLGPYRSPNNRKVPTEAGLKKLRNKYKGRAFAQRPFFIDERSWSIFRDYITGQRSLREMRESEGIAPSRLRQILNQVDTQLDLPGRSELEWNAITPQSPIEDLALSIRARNALHHLACRNVDDVLQLNLSGSVARFGGKTKIEVLTALQAAGFRHPALDRGPVEGVTSLARSLGRMQDRINVALRSVAKEVSMVQRQLQHWLKE